MPSPASRQILEAAGSRRRRRRQSYRLGSSRSPHLSPCRSPTQYSRRSPRHTPCCRRGSPRPRRDYPDWDRGADHIRPGVDHRYGVRDLVLPGDRDLGVLREGLGAAEKARDGDDSGCEQAEKVKFHGIPPEADGARRQREGPIPQFYSRLYWKRRRGER